MLLRPRFSGFGAALLLFTTTAWAEPMIIDDFNAPSPDRWRFFTDQVMGGVSSGQAQFLNEGDVSFVRMTGDVSTANNGGFIQIRVDLPRDAADGANGVRLRVRGNDQQYFIHLRNAATMLPWQYYQAEFQAGSAWAEVRLPFEMFQASGDAMRASPRTDSLKSVGIVAYGRDHRAQIDVSEIGFY